MLIIFEVWLSSASPEFNTVGWIIAVLYGAKRFRRARKRNAKCENIFEIVNGSPMKKKPEDNETCDTVSLIYLRNKGKFWNRRALLAWFWYLRSLAMVGKVRVHLCSSCSSLLHNSLLKSTHWLIDKSINTLQIRIQHDSKEDGDDFGGHKNRERTRQKSLTGLALPFHPLSQ